MFFAPNMPSFPVKQSVTPEGRAVALAYLHLTDERMAAMFQAGASGGLEVACKPGCAACCTYLVGATLHEAVLVAEEIQKQPQAARTATLGRLVAWERLWVGLYGKAKLCSPEQGIAWQHKRIPCPMLDPKTYLCTVYDVRPLACRSHHACYLPEGATLPCQSCPTLAPGDGCFTSDENLAHNHDPQVWMIRGDLMLEYTHELAGQLVSKQENGYPEPGLLTLLVLRAGRELFGWRNPPKSLKLPILQHASPRGATL